MSSTNMMENIHASFHADSSVTRTKMINDKWSKTLTKCEFVYTFTKRGNVSLIAFGDIKSFPHRQKQTACRYVTKDTHSF